jgi:hypothetical protein
VAKDIRRIGMSENPIKIIVGDYIDGAGQRGRLGDPYYPYMWPTQVDEIQLSKLYYLCHMLSAPHREFTWRMFQAALDIALDEYCAWSGKEHLQAYSEMQQMRQQMEQQGFFENLRKQGWVTGKREDPSNEGSGDT